MKYSLLVACIAFFGCIPAVSQADKARAVKVRVMKNVDVALANSANHQTNPVLSFLQEELNQTIPKGWEVWYYGDYMVGCSDGGLVGFLEGYANVNAKVIAVYVYQPCIAASVLIHEAMHTLGYMHGREMKKVEERIQRKALEKFCPGYEVIPPPETTEEMAIEAYLWCQE